MEINTNVFGNLEEKSLELCSMYSSYGYDLFRMSKFEEYSLYEKYRDFLVSDNILSFTDIGGRLMALKPDITLSLVKNCIPEKDKVSKFFYKENCYRSVKGSGFKEITQVGLECLGAVNFAVVGEVLWLACKSLENISGDYVLEVSSLDILMAYMNGLSIDAKTQKKIIDCLGEKNIHEIEDICEKEGIPDAFPGFRKLLSINGGIDVLSSVRQFCDEYGLEHEYFQLERSLSVFDGKPQRAHIQIDFSIAENNNYYNGIVFSGYINGIPDSVLSGGQYDMLLKRMNIKANSIGFAVYMDELAPVFKKTEKTQADGEGSKLLRIALPKGRLGEKAYRMLEKAGYACPEMMEESRKLVFENKEAGVCYFWAKPSDVAIYVERGAADIGVVGKDILLEHFPEVYELLDLGIGKCRMCVAGPADFTDDRSGTLKVATKFTEIAGNYYASKGRDIDIINLNGSIEIAPVLGLSDVIVDIVETGTTLKENDLAVLEEILNISARLISNKSSYRFKSEQIDAICSSIKLSEEQK